MTESGCARLAHPDPSPNAARIRLFAGQENGAGTSVVKERLRLGARPTAREAQRSWRRIEMATFRIGFVLFPRLTQLDLTGPFEILSRMRDAETLLAAKTRDPVPAERGLSIVPTA